MAKKLQKSRFVAYSEEGEFCDAEPITDEDREKAKCIWDELTGKNTK